MNKNYVVIMLFNKNYNKVLLVKRSKNPYKGCWNGIGGKIESGETPVEAARRECKEETGISMNKPKLLVTYVYPEDNILNSNTKLNVIYDCVDEVYVTDNSEGHYEWKNIDFVMNSYNKEIAGLSNLNQFIKEIFDLENIKKFYDCVNNKDFISNKNITVVIDGQAGSCGKGKICGYLAKHTNFSMATNNWSSNAGHTYVDDNGKKIIVSHLPMAMVNSNCKLVLNAGCVITPEILFDEIRKYSDLIGNRKIYINPRAMIIQNRHREEEKKIIKSGSTFKGCGVAQAEKIIRKPGTILAKDYFKTLPNDMKNKIEIVDTAIMINNCTEDILIEGSQGQDLDINYGLDYPNVTSRMCSTSQLIADAGCSPFKVKEIYMIIRPYPIRISNKTNIGIDIYSGDYAGSKEISWEEVKKRSGCNIELKEYTTVTKKVRRVFEMNWERLKYNVMINQPTQIVLNFAQYIDWKAYKCRDYKKLPNKVLEFIKKIEEETNVPVTIIGTGECESDIIDLRK
ncbi:adenylosuccinate synthetase 2 [Clostridium sp. CAG:440]|nr:adenylosuccinate synthetase 2 [Clostridium sp. CAG:440]